MAAGLVRRVLEEPPKRQIGERKEIGVLIGPALARELQEYTRHRAIGQLGNRTRFGRRTGRRELECAQYGKRQRTHDTLRAKPLRAPFVRHAHGSVFFISLDALDARRVANASSEPGGEGVH